MHRCPTHAALPSALFLVFLSVPAGTAHAGQFRRDLLRRRLCRRDQPGHQRGGDQRACGANPQGVAVSPDGSRVYVANRGSGTVSVIDGGSPHGGAGAGETQSRCGGFSRSASPRTRSSHARLCDRQLQRSSIDTQTNQAIKCVGTLGRGSRGRRRHPGRYARVYVTLVDLVWRYTRHQRHFRGHGERGVRPTRWSSTPWESRWASLLGNEARGVSGHLGRQARLCGESWRQHRPVIDTSAAPTG